MQRSIQNVGLAALALSAAIPPLAAQEKPKPQKPDTTRVYPLEPVTVEGRIDDLGGVATSASQGRVGIEDLRLRPLAREGELLEVVPGMILTQHSGDGKSNQMFVRGFNLDHGTDFSTIVEGMPVNMPTHGHGQGYTDLSFITPEFVDHLEYRLGVYYPQVGDFGSAGSVHVRLANAFSSPFVRLEAGAHRFRRAVGAGSTRLGNGALLVGGEVKHYDGPWAVPQALGKWSGLGRYTWDAGANRVSVLALTYGNRWTASDQIPQRAVAAGDVSRFGQIDSTLGGRSRRHSLSAAWTRTGAAGGFRLSAYGVVSTLDLFSNFTYFLDNPVRGDQIEQRDDRIVTGLDAELQRFVRLFGRNHGIRVGLHTRFDEIDVALHRTTGRARFATVRIDAVSARAGALYVATESRWTDAVRTVVGLRGDVQSFSVRSVRPENSGSRAAAIITPKATLIVAPWSSTELYVSGGSGFHSNDARATTISVHPETGEPVVRTDPLVRSLGAEVGLRAALRPGFRSTLALWWLELASELVFLGDVGATEASGRSRRVGATWATFWRLRPQLALDVDVSLTNARLADEPDGQNYVPNALDRVISAGIAWETSGKGPMGAVRLRHFGGHPLVGDNSVRGAATTLVNLSAGWTFGGIRATLTILNVLDAEGADIQYFYTSRGPNEPRGIDGVHFHPVEPRQLRVAVSWWLSGRT